MGAFAGKSAPSTAMPSLPGQGPRGTAGFLRLPRRTLGSSAHRQPDRERLRHGPAPDRPDQGRALAEDGEADGLHPRPRSLEAMAPAAGRQPVASRRRWHQVHRRCRHPRCRKPRRLIRPRHPDSAIAPTASRWTSDTDSPPSVTKRVCTRSPRAERIGFAACLKGFSVAFTTAAALSPSADGSARRTRQPAEADVISRQRTPSFWSSFPRDQSDYEAIEEPFAPMPSAPPRSRKRDSILSRRRELSRRRPLPAACASQLSGRSGFEQPGSSEQRLSRKREPTCHPNR